MAAFDRRLAGSLPPAACQRQAERAAVAVGHPGKLRTVPQCVFQRRVGSGPLYQAAHALLHLRRAVPGGLHHFGDLVILGCRCRFCRGHTRVLQRGQLVIHLGGQRGTALAVLCHQRIGVVYQRPGIHGAVGGYVVGHQLPGLVVEPGQLGNIAIPGPCCYFHRRPSPSAPAARAPAAPGP